MSVQVRLSSRMRFVLRRGVLPWGVLAGIVAAALVALDAPHGTDGTSTRSTIILCILCFAIWTALIGWAIGNVRWELRSSKTDARHKGRQRRGGR
jgi:hypothetical protein